MEQDRCHASGLEDDPTTAGRSRQGIIDRGLRVVCIESPQAYQALKLLATHKTDRNDAAMAGAPGWHPLVPGLESGWRQIDDSTWEFKFDLVDNTWFHNGEKFSAADVQYYFRSPSRPEAGCRQFGVCQTGRADFVTEISLTDVFGPSMPSGSAR